MDPFDLAQVIHALITKCHPYRGIVKLDHTPGTALTPFLSQHEQKYLIGAKAYFDCTWPPDWDPADIPKRCSFENVYSSEMQQRALDKWQKYGY